MPNFTRHQSLPATLDGKWEGTKEPVKVFFKVKDDKVEDLDIEYLYGNSVHCDYKNVRIKQSNNSKPIEHTIEDNHFTIQIPATYKLDDFPVSDKRLVIKGAFDKSNSSVSGKLDLETVRTMKKTINNKSSQSIQCIEERKGIPWSAKKVR